MSYGFAFREICEIAIKDLPAHNIDEVDTWCDVCIKKGNDKQQANIYCTDCNKKFCTEHEKVRDYTDLL